MAGITEIFGSMVFSDSVMKERLPHDIYRSLKESARFGERLTQEVADVVANSMKHWAIEKGATHFSHWFQPMNGITAEKHECFISPTGDGRVIMDFSGKELIRGESDASSFPSGGLRATFEARGYTAWDPTSYAFIKDRVLCIPTSFCSYGGEALDRKTPLLRSMEVLNTNALRIVRLFGNTDATSVNATTGSEQEYFLVDRELFDNRKDLIYTGRTLFGARPPKGQEMSDHYFGAIKPRVAEFMRDLDEELWSLGILAKTEHNEAAPAQHELAPIYTTVNIAADHNQLIMDRMRTVAERHGMVCLLHEKPFAGVNGSGKHNNWSLTTDKGENLLEPGDTPSENAQFLTFLCAVLKAVCMHQDLLRISVATVGNDLRLGGSEAPPAIISVFLGEELTNILQSIENDSAPELSRKVPFKIGVHSMPPFPKDTTDRNRTSPFAFTGNKFEFRMVGSSASISFSNTVLNTAVADVLSGFADRLEAASDFESELHSLIQETVRENKHIIFNGNGYDDSWTREAQQRGLLNLRSVPECLPYYLSEENIAFFERNRVLSRIEIKARYDIVMENYCKNMKIEAQTMLYMLRREILPACSAYCAKLASDAAAKISFSPEADCTYESDLVKKMSQLQKYTFIHAAELEKNIERAETTPDVLSRARQYNTMRFGIMEDIRARVDEMEEHTSRECWPYPTYGELLFSLR